MVRVTRPGDPVTVGLTRLGQARVLEERPTEVRMLACAAPLRHSGEGTQELTHTEKRVLPVATAFL